MLLSMNIQGKTISSNLQDVKATEITEFDVVRNVWKDRVGMFGRTGWGEGVWVKTYPLPHPFPLVRQSETGERQMPGDTRRGHTQH